MRLRLDDRDGVLKITYPRRVRPSAALAWAAAQREWVDEQLRRRLPPEPFVPGAVVPIAGEEVELSWESAAPRSPRLESGKLTCGGPIEGFSSRIELFLKRLALQVLSSETADIADRARLRVSSVRIGDARTRWGSCSSKGAIRYNWRLILAAPEARRYVVCHEVAHLRHLDHSRNFYAFERELFGGDTAPAAALLRAHGPRLRRIGLAR